MNLGGVGERGMTMLKIYCMKIPELTIKRNDMWVLRNRHSKHKNKKTTLFHWTEYIVNTIKSTNWKIDLSISLKA